MKKIIILLIGCISAFMMTDAVAMFSRLSTLSKKVITTRKYSTNRVMPNDTVNTIGLIPISNKDVQQELNKKDKSIAELELEREELILKRSRLIALYEKVCGKPFETVK
jgi:hypothetical protein